MRKAQVNEEEAKQMFYCCSNILQGECVTMASCGQYLFMYLYLYVLFFCTLIYSYQYFKGFQMPCVSTEIISYNILKYLENIKCIRQLHLNNLTMM